MSTLTRGQATKVFFSTSLLALGACAMPPEASSRASVEGESAASILAAPTSDDAVASHAARVEDDQATASAAVATHGLDETEKEPFDEPGFEPGFGDRGMIEPGVGDVDPGFGDSRFGDVEPGFGDVEPGFGDVEPGFGEPDAGRPGWMRPGWGRPGRGHPGWWSRRWGRPGWGPPGRWWGPPRWGWGPPRGDRHCGGNICRRGEYCCNRSCGICAPVGGYCTQQVCR